jgi:alkylation response protein AidB-like acyl-CoA dehydrogenase
MDLEFTLEERSFREEVRTWLEENKPSEPRPKSDDLEQRNFDLAWQRTLYDNGWAGIAWPKAYGGRELGTIAQLIWFEEYAKAKAPYLGANFVGINHGGPTLIARATEEQKKFHLPKILKGEVVWCQGFSEPGSGSDLASLSTKAVVDGDELVITGQKIWTSFAHIADYQELLVRTDPNAPKHKGISWVICDMHAPGITIRQIPTIIRGAEFCEVFYDEVRLPLTSVVGDVNDGWSVAMSTLSFERGTGFMAAIIELTTTIEELIDIAKHKKSPDGKRTYFQDDEYRRKLISLKAEIMALRSATYRAISRNMRQDAPGPEGSILKLVMSDLNQKLARLGVDILGVDALAFGGSHRDGGVSTAAWLGSFSGSIAGGTSEIQRNIVSERVLGMPRG